MKASPLLVCSAFFVSAVNGFTTSTTTRTSSITTPTTTQIQASPNDNDSHDSRRQFMSKTVAKTVASYSAAALAGVAGVGTVLAPLPANAASAEVKINARLKGYGLPPITTIASGMKPLLEVYGKGKNRFPLLVLMNHPLTWVVQLPSNDVNGEDGTVQAGEYAKGDTATLFVYEEEGHIADLYKTAVEDKAIFTRTLIKAISQKGGNMYQDFKVTKVLPQTDNPAYLAGKQYVLCDFQYTLLTGAGFEVQRSGVASITSEGPAIEALWAASTRIRFKKTEQQLRDIVSSFRIYGDGLNFDQDIAKIDARFGMPSDV
mmetsp:Transcript_56565/g.63264  ORF Transcript_56565/g.63264 Transcript_56565/m.63264 type:complete len:317 (-) Transcript_56565:133-1083(-)